MRTRAATRAFLVVLLAAAFWLTAGQAQAETPSPTPSPEPSNNPFATLQPVTLFMWLGSAAIALVAVLYAVERERRKHGD
ncbi:MAG: hypothetical protein ACOYBY_08985 [Dermatophilaceae bacterium]